MGLLGIMGYLGISTTSNITQKRHTFHYLEECQVLIWRIILLIILLLIYKTNNKLNNEGQHGFRGSHGALGKEAKTIAIKHYKFCAKLCSTKCNLNSSLP